MAKLTFFREKLHLTQEELAEKSGVSVRTTQRIEAGTIPKGFTLKTLGIFFILITFIERQFLFSFIA